MSRRREWGSGTHSTKCCLLLGGDLVLGAALSRRGELRSWYRARGQVGRLGDDRRSPLGVADGGLERERRTRRRCFGLGAHRTRPSSAVVVHDVVLVECGAALGLDGRGARCLMRMARPSCRRQPRLGRLRRVGEGLGRVESGCCEEPLAQGGDGRGGAEVRVDRVGRGRRGGRRRGHLVRRRAGCWSHSPRTLGVAHAQQSGPWSWCEAPPPPPSPPRLSRRGRLAFFDARALNSGSLPLLRDSHLGKISSRDAIVLRVSDSGSGEARFLRTSQKRLGRRRPVCRPSRTYELGCRSGSHRLVGPDVKKVASARGACARRQALRLRVT